MKKVKFLNTQVFDQLNWDKEIVEPTVSQDAQYLRLSNAVQIWVLAKQQLAGNVKAAEKPHEKSNMMRMHQYFYAKFLYQHALAYGKDVDLLKEDKSSGREEDVMVYLKRVLGDKLERSKLPLNKMVSIRRIFYEVIKKRRDEQKSANGGYDEVKTLFEAEGLKCVKPKGLCKEGDRDTVCTIHDGVRYHLSLMKNSESRTKDKAKQEADEHKEMIKYYHTLVKEVYEKIKQFPDIGDVWAMEGGGMQHQVFFGNKNGYLGILGLDMKNLKKQPVNKSYTLQVQSVKNDKVFKKFNVKNVKISTCFEVYGNQLED